MADFRCKSGLDRVHEKIFEGVGEVILIADVAVEILFHPKLSGSVEYPIRLVRAERPPRVHDVRQTPAFRKFDDDMHMVRHDAVGDQNIPIPVEMTKGVDDYLGDARVAKKATAISRILIAVDGLAEIDHAGVFLRAVRQVLQGF